jgi:predicted nucleic acid-binding protein
VAVVVFDAGVLIAYLGREDAQHVRAVERVRAAVEPGTRRLLSAVNYSEVLIGPLRAGGAAAADAVDAVFARLGIETVVADRELARSAASVRERVGVRLPDAYAIATAIEAAERGRDDVRLESFDEQVVKAHARLHSSNRS